MQHSSRKKGPARSGTSEPTPNDASRLTATPPRVSRTYVSDHVWMMDVPDNAFRMWLTVRAYVYDKDPASTSVQITDEELATLMHRTVSAVRSIRRRAYACGLLAEKSRTTESYRGSDGRNRLRTVRRIEVLHLDPPEGYTGPTNAYTELRRIRSAAGRAECQENDTHNDQGEHNVATGRTECHFSSRGCEKSINPCEKSSDLTPADQGKPAPQVLSQVPNQPTNGETPTSPSRGVDLGWLAGEEDPSTAGASLLASLRAQNGQPLASHAIARYAPVVDALLEASTPQAVRERLSSGVGTPGGIVHRLRDAETQPKTIMRSPQGSDGPNVYAEARIANLAARLDDSGARETDRILGTSEWREPPRGDHDARTYLVEVLPQAARQFVEERRERLLSVLTTDPTWRAA